MFRKYHYLNTDLNIACRQFVGVVDGELVCHTGLLTMPMMRDAKRLHRSVVLPDYQGIGIGMAFKKAVCDIVRKEGWTGQIWSTTTTPAQYHAQCKSPYWKLVRYGRSTIHRDKKWAKMADVAKLMKASSSRGRITYSFVYVGDEGKERVDYNTISE